MKLPLVLVLALLSCSCASKTLSCRVLAIEGAKVYKSPWQSGADGCNVARDTAKLGDKLFGDVLDYSVQYRTGKQRGVLPMRDLRKVSPDRDGNLYVLPLPENVPNEHKAERY
jgi:hypothetical protein